MPQSHTTVARARWATSLAFAVHGAIAGSFATRIPQLQQGLDLSAGQLGAALMAPAIGALVAMPMSSLVMHRFGLRRTTRVALVLWCLTLVLPAVAFNLAAFFVALLIFGACSAVADVSMNSSGVSLEKARGAPVMSSLHGMWGVGMLAGSGIGVAAAHGELAPLWHFASVAVVLAAIAVVLPRYTLDINPETPDEKPPAFALPTKSVLPIGVVGFCAVFIEGAAGNWSAVYLVERADASPGLAALSVSAFMLAMAVARLLGDSVVRVWGPVASVRVSGGVAAVGAVLVTFASTSWLAIAGFMLIGVGVAIVVPMCLAAAGRVGTNQSRSIAGMVTMTEGSNILAPAIVGGIAAVATLSVSFGFVALLALVMIPAAGALRVAHPDDELLGIGV